MMVNTAIVSHLDVLSGSHIQPSTFPSALDYDACETTLLSDSQVSYTFM